MKERPIIFDAESVTSILSGIKTQTRRVVKPQPVVPVNDAVGMYDARDVCYIESIDEGVVLWEKHQKEWGMPQSIIDDSRPGGIEYWREVCPYGGPGNLLWARETWRMVGWTDDFVGAVIGYRADSEKLWRESPDSDEWEDWVLREIERFSRLPGVVLEDGEYEIDDESNIPWRSPIFMPRWASRITLEITDVGVERLQDISQEDALEEGVETDLWDQAVVARDYSGEGKWFESWGCDDTDTTKFVPYEEIARASFASRWDSINSKRGYTWESNPWVWVIEFERVEDEE